MILIVGLGNPGEKFKKTRHNLGFMIVESLKHAPYRNEVSGAGLKVKSFSDWKNNKKFLSEISKGEIAGQKIILVKPQTFMNESGKAVKILTKTYNLKPKTLIVVHDDIDLPLGKIKISIGKGAAGHKGVESIIKEIKTKDFVRVRVGICPKTGKPKNVEKFVLQKPSEAKPNEAGDETKSQRPFNKEEEKIVKEVIKRTVEAVEYLLREGLEKAMTKFNK